jgi:hypothetical protein
MPDRDELEDARHGVLVENTAQAIHKHLDKLINGATRYRKRWVWELLQNARDAASEAGVRVALAVEEGRLVLHHDGLPFTAQGIAHLICHGSTKHDLADPVGHFGTGFLTTHLISLRVRVRGLLTDGRGFEFDLDREGGSAGRLQAAMDESWQAFRASLSPATTTAAAGEGFTTEYVYPVTTPEVAAVVRDGVADLERNAPFVLAFNERIKSVRIGREGSSLTIRKEAVEPIHGSSTVRVVVSSQPEGAEATCRYVAVQQEDGVTAATELVETPEGWKVIVGQATPRVFVAFPLTGTEDFFLPVVVNSTDFKPREERDGLHLNGESDENRRNKRLVTTACTLAARLSAFAASQGWASSASLALIPELKEPEWLDGEWARETIDSGIVEPVRHAAVLLNHAGKRIAPMDSWIPLAEDGTDHAEMWRVASRLRAARAKVPALVEAGEWADNLLSWARLKERPAVEFPEGLGLGKLCKIAAATGSITELRDALAEGVEPLDWLNDLYALIAQGNRLVMFDQHRLLPDQSGVLRGRAELKRDDGVDEELKGIAEGLDLKVRSSLLDRRVHRDEILKLFEAKTTEQVLTEALQRLKEIAEANADDERLVGAGMSMFGWIIKHGKTANLDGFPIAPQEGSRVLHLKRSATEEDDTPLAPSACWPEGARPFSDLFPGRHTVANVYSGATDAAGWERIAEQGYVRLTPLYITRRRVTTFIPDEPLPEKEEKGKKARHETQEPVEVSALAFFEKEDLGINLVRKSRGRAALLLRFILSYALPVDSRALETPAAACDCGKNHRYYRASWLAPLWNRNWLPLTDSKPAPATAEFLAQFLENYPDLAEPLTTGRGPELLGALNISVADLLIRTIAKSEDERVAYIGSLSEVVKAAGHDLQVFQAVAAELVRSPELFEQIQQHRERREKVERNQAVGKAVEALLKAALEAEKLRVTRTGVGSDFEIDHDLFEVDHDLIEDGREVLLEVGDGEARPFLVEVKATTGTSVRMTVAQARTATEERGRFVLCIVRLDRAEIDAECVRENSRFVFDIGTRLEPVWDEFTHLEKAKEEATRPVEGIELVVTRAETRFSVGDSVWDDGLSLVQALERFRQRKGGNGDAGTGHDSASRLDNSSTTER